MAAILWFSWKDKQHPEAGGAEVVGDELRKKLVLHGHTVTHVTAFYPGAKEKETLDGITSIRLHAPKLLLWLASGIYYLRHLKNTHDIIIEEVNTAPYFLSYVKGKERLFLFYHQLTEEVWNYEFPAPFSWIMRYIAEPLALFLQQIKKPQVITVSESSKKDLVKHKFSSDIITIISEATNIVPLRSLSDSLPKNDTFTVLYFGSLRSMKRPEEVIKGFATAYKTQSAELWIAGNGTQERKNYLKSLAQQLGIEAQVTWFTHIDDAQKRELFQRAHVFSTTSTKEGWGLVVIEAAVLGTPAVAYDVDGLRDAILDKQTGLVVPNNNFQALGEAFKSMSGNIAFYEQLRQNAFNHYKDITFDTTYADFRKIIGVK